MDDEVRQARARLKLAERAVKEARFELAEIEAKQEGMKDEPNNHD
ncbi:MAG: hypothetical protein ACO35I_06165 [Burkholderiaceae bacterium]